MSIEDLEKINGGTNKEFTAFVRHLMDKYGVMKHHAAYAWATPEEKEQVRNYAEYLENQKKAELEKYIEFLAQKHK
jgi:hypothetical protein